MDLDASRVGMTGGACLGKKGMEPMVSAEIQSLVYRGGCGDHDGTSVDGWNRKVRGEHK